MKAGSGESCSAAPEVPSGAKGACNLNRASYDEEGNCVCASDWAGAPECNDLPLWKWLVTIGGGLAALVSCNRKRRKNRILTDPYRFRLQFPSMLMFKEENELHKIGIH